ncbi:Mg2+ transporter protein CorA-like/Zinc transport protein ZntB [Penicillium expansum]|nr:Mg2+ transporter protein CorA-like/Zinc transport protein ZntB [Penicillium expansum]
MENDQGLYNAAEWTVHEGENEQNGIHIRLRKALLIERDSEDEQFQATVVIKTDVSGFAFGALQQDPRDDPVIFDPARSEAGILNSKVSMDNLETVDLSSLERVDLSSMEAVPDLAEAQTRRNVTEILDNIASSYVQSDTQQKVESHYYEIWNARREGRGWVKVEEDAARINSKALASVLTPTILKDSFPWMKQAQVRNFRPVQFLRH